MMRGTTLQFLFAGALLASLGWNLVQWSACGPAPASIEAATPTTPSRATWCAMLDLRDDQLEQLGNCCDQCCGDLAGLLDAARAKAEELQRAIAAAEPDAARVRELGRELAALRARAVEQNVEAMLRVRAILTGPQVDKLVACFASGCVPR